MAELPLRTRVVIIGGGAVGTSCLFHLAKSGLTDCVLLEKNELTSGSTWHAAGNVPTFSASWSLMHMQRYSVDLYKTLGEDVDYPMNYHVTGSVRLAHSKERMQEFQRACDMGKYQGMDMEICSVDDLKSKYPFLETHDLVGGLYDPNDGDIDPSQLTQALAKGARDMGAKIIRFCPVTGVEKDGDDWVVQTSKGEIRCEKIVNAAGYRAQEVAEMFKPHGGRTLPMMTMSHQYLLTDEIPEIEEWSKANDQKLPLLRDVDSSYYLRQEKFGLNLGPYEQGCRAHWMNADDPMPEDFSFQLFSDDLERLEWYIEDAMKRVPLLGNVGINKVINGPIPYTPDGNPLIGPMPGVPNAYEACVFTFGIAQAGGAGKVLAEWVIDGQTEWDMWSCDPRRFTEFCDQDYTNKKGVEIYSHEYAMHFPKFEWPDGRDKKLSSLHECLKDNGAQFGAYNGWERANWFAEKGDDTSKAATQTWERDGPWQQRIREECLAVRDGCGVLDLPGFSRFEVTGDGAAQWLREQISGVVPRAGRIGLAYFSDTRGRIMTEMSVVRHAEDHLTLITAATAQWHDFELLSSTLPDDLAITIDDRTDEIGTLIIAGPKSREVLQNICTADLSLGWLTHQSASIAGKDALFIRVSFTGELGWEIHAKHEDMVVIYNEIIANGAKPFGMYALDSLRLEKGYRTWKGDLSSDYSLLEGGLDRFIKLDKPEDFPGKAASLSQQQQGVSKRFVTLLVDSDTFDPPYMSTLWFNGEIVGETTSAGWGHRIDKCIALGMLRIDLTTPNTVIEIEIYGEKHKATVQPDQPLWDPENERLKA